jgi:hypothetical protein
MLIKDFFNYPSFSAGFPDFTITDSLSQRIRKTHKTIKPVRTSNEGIKSDFHLLIILLQREIYFRNMI